MICKNTVGIGNYKHYNYSRFNWKMLLKQASTNYGSQM